MSEEFGIETSINDVGSDYIEIGGKVTGLKKPYNEGDFDGCLIKYVIGQEEDLSDGEFLSDKKDGLVYPDGVELPDVGDVVIQTAEELDPDTQYYVRALGIGLDFKSELSMEELVISENGMETATNGENFMDKVTDKEMPMDKVSDSEIAMGKVSDSEIAMDKVTDKEMPMDKVTDKEMPMGKVSDSEIAMDKVTDKEMPMDKVMANVMPRTKMLLSPYIVDTVWSKEMANEKFWEEVSFDIGSTFDGSVLKANLTGVNNLLVYVKAGRDAWIYVNDDEIYVNRPSSWTKIELDVSDYSGECGIKFGLDESYQGSTERKLWSDTPDDKGYSVQHYEDGFEDSRHASYYGIRLEE